MTFEALKKLLELWYQDSNIPAYIYQNDQVVCAIPVQTELTFPPLLYYRKLKGTDDLISCCSTDYGLYFGQIRIKNKADTRIVFGPVNNVPYQDKDFHQLYRDYVISIDKQESLRQFCKQTCLISLTGLLTKLTFLCYCINGESGSLRDSLIPAHDEAHSNTAEGIYHQKELFRPNRSYEAEAIVLNAIRQGVPSAIANLSLNESNINTGIIGSTPLRQIKNNIIIVTTLSTRAAIDGGLDYDTAYHMSDEFIQEAEKLQSADALYALLSKISYAFAEKVAEERTPVASNDIIQKAIRFIQQNTNQHITVDDVAKDAGFSRSYFSSYFKKELGFSISAFITRCKLEEGKRLLQYTDKPLSVISNYLCFSSQSHFQTAFKKQFGVTPMQYRKNPNIPR